MQIIPNHNYYYVETNKHQYIFLRKKDYINLTDSMYVYSIKQRCLYDGVGQIRFRVCSNKSIDFLRLANVDEIKLIKSEISKYEKENL